MAKLILPDRGAVMLPKEVERSLAGYSSSGEDMKTASDSNVFRYVHASSDSVRFLKIQRFDTWSPPLSREADAMIWLADRLPVPEVVLYHRADETEYLITVGLPGISTENNAFHGNKQRLVEQLADALHTIHAIPIDDCPLDRTPDKLIAHGRQRIQQGLVTRKMVEDEGLAGTPEDALNGLVDRAPGSDPLAFTHGDYCLPNVMIHERRISGFIDLGYAGVGDLYRDFTSAQYSVRRNLGEEWVQPFFDAYGAESLDGGKLRWYRNIQAFV